MHRVPAFAALMVLAAGGAAHAQSRLQLQPLQPSGSSTGPAPVTRLSPPTAPVRSRVGVTALACSEVTIAPLRTALGAAAAVAGSGLPMRAVPPPERSRVTIAALAASRVLIEPLAATAAVAAAALKSELGVRETERGTLISLPGDVLFDFDKYAIRRDAPRPTLGKLAELIIRRPKGGC